MNILDRIETKMRGLFGQLGARVSTPHEMEAPEIRRAVLEDIRSKIQPKGRGEYVFPYSGVEITVYAFEADRRDALEAALVETLPNDIAEALTAPGCAAPVVTVSVVEGPELDVPFKIAYSKAKPQSQAAIPTTRPPARLTIEKGKAQSQAIDIASDTILMGRLTEVTDRSGATVRRNHVAFDDSENSVSRKHARLSYAEGKFRLYNDPDCKTGTRVFRDGERLECDSIRGIQLRSGDEIHLGEARLRFEILP